MESLLVVEELSLPGEIAVGQLSDVVFGFVRLVQLFGG